MTILLLLICVLLLGALFMGAQILAALSTQAAAIEALKGRLAGQAGITTAEAQQILDTTNANTASVNAILA